MDLLTLVAVKSRLKEEALRLRTPVFQEVTLPGGQKRMMQVCVDQVQPTPENFRNQMIQVVENLIVDLKLEATLKAPSVPQETPNDLPRAVVA